MSATHEPSWKGRITQESWSLDHCEAEVAHLYKVLHRYRNLTEESGWAQFDGRARVGTDRAQHPAAAGALGNGQRS